MDENQTESVKHRYKNFLFKNKNPFPNMRSLNGSRAIKIQNFKSSRHIRNERTPPLQRGRSTFTVATSSILPCSSVKPTSSSSPQEESLPTPVILTFQVILQVQHRDALLGNVPRVDTTGRKVKFRWKWAKNCNFSHCASLFWRRFDVFFCAWWKK